MLKYIRGVQRRVNEFRIDVNLFTDSIFNDTETGLVTALDNELLEQQSSGGNNQVA